MNTWVLDQRSASYQSLQTRETELRSFPEFRRERTRSRTSSGNGKDSWVDSSESGDDGSGFFLFRFMGSVGKEKSI